jgi:hypothetical protein
MNCFVLITPNRITNPISHFDLIWELQTIRLHQIKKTFVGKHYQSSSEWIMTRHRRTRFRRPNSRIRLRGMGKIRGREVWSLKALHNSQNSTVAAAIKFTFILHSAEWHRADSELRGSLGERAETSVDRPWQQ